MPGTRIDARCVGWLTLLVLLLALPAFAGFAGVAWEAFQLAGYIGAWVCILLTGAPLRPRISVPPTLISLQRHTLLGWIALSATTIHIGGLVIADRTVIEYLKPTAPPYQLAGMIAAVTILFLGLTGIPSVRRRLWRSHRGFQATHVVVSYLLACLVVVHIAVTARYLGGWGRRTLFAAAALGAVFMLLRARRSAPASPATAYPSPSSRPSPAAHPPPAEPPAAAGATHRRSVFGRNSTLIVAAAVACAAAIAAALPARVEATLREPLMQRTRKIPLAFPHDKHGAVNCLTCHHNYADGRGMQACIECHRGPRADLTEGAEARFHGFCLNCHRHPDASLQKHGPVSGCAICHRPSI